MGICFWNFTQQVGDVPIAKSNPEGSGGGDAPAPNGEFGLERN